MKKKRVKVRKKLPSNLVVTRIERPKRGKGAKEQDWKKDRDIFLDEMLYARRKYSEFNQGELPY